MSGSEGSVQNENLKDESEGCKTLEVRHGAEISGGDKRRKSSSVSFSDTYDLYEMDMEKGERRRQVIKLKPSAFKSVRYYVVLLALVSPFVVTYSRTIINFAIIDMIDPQPVESREEAPATNETEIDTPYFELDESCPAGDAVRQRLIEENTQDMRRAHENPGEKFKWDTFRQGLLKAAYSIGHAPLQLTGSRMSEIYGSQRVISISSALIALSCVAAPYLAAVEFYLLFADLIFLGVLGSFMTPALITLFSNWLTPSEKTIMLSFYLISSRLGYALSSFLCGLLIQAQLSWRYVFFSAGWISLAFAVIFYISARSRPSDHPLISQLELDYLATKNVLVREQIDQSNNCKLTTNCKQERGSDANKMRLKEKKKKNAAPWAAILTNKSVWSFIVTKFCVKLTGDTVTIELPTYLKRVMHLPAKDNGMINAWNYVIFCAGIVSAGALAKTITKRQLFGLSKTAVRKLFQSVASFGVASILIGVAFSVCDNISTQVFFMLLFLMTTFGVGGEAQTPLDITVRYSGTIHALASSLAITGVIEPTLVGFLLRGRAADRNAWKFVWLGASAISFLGGLVYLLFADSSIQPFDALPGGHETEVKKDIPGGCGGEGNLRGAFEREDASDAKKFGALEVPDMVQQRESREI